MPKTRLIARCAAVATLIAAVGFSAGHSAFALGRGLSVPPKSYTLLPGVPLVVGAPGILAGATNSGGGGIELTSLRVADGLGATTITFDRRGGFRLTTQTRPGSDATLLATVRDVATGASTQTFVTLHPLVFSLGGGDGHRFTYGSPGSASLMAQADSVTFPVRANGNPSTRVIAAGLRLVDRGNVPTVETDGTTPAGSYSVEMGAVVANHVFSVTKSIVVDRRPALIAANDLRLARSERLPSLTATVTGVLARDHIPYSCTAPPHAEFGDYPISCRATETAPNYSVTTRAGVLSIRPTVVVTPAETTYVYGDSPVTTASPLYSGLADGHVPAQVGTCARRAYSSDHPGVYVMTCSGFSDPAYTFSYEPGSQTVTPRPIGVTSDATTINFATPIPTHVPVYSNRPSGLAGYFDHPATCSSHTSPISAASTAVAAGVYRIDCSGASDRDFTFIYTPSTLTVLGIPVTVTAPSPTITYGDPIVIPAPTYTTDVARSALTCTTTATSYSAVGTYPVTCSGRTNPLYFYTFADGTLTIAKRSVVVAAPDAASTYGDPLVGIGAPRLLGMVYNQQTRRLDTLTTAPQCEATLPVSSDRPAGGYPVTCSGAADDRYSFTYLSGTYTVRKRPATAIPSETHSIIGQPLPTIEPSYVGFIAGKTSPNIARGECHADPAATNSLGTITTPGRHTAVCSGALDSNYSFTYPVIDSLILSLPVVLVFPPSSTIYAGDDPHLVASYADQRTPQNPSVCTVIGASAPYRSGAYRVTCTTPSDPFATYVVVGDGLLTVIDRPLPPTVSGPSLSVPYGEAIPVLVPAYANVAPPVGHSNCTTTATSTSVPGTYPVECAAAGAEVGATTAQGVLTITAIAINVQAPDATSIYGGPIGPLSPHYTVGAGTAPTPASVAVCTTTATSSSAVGNYIVTCAGAADSGETFTYLDGSYSITPASVTVTAPDRDYVQGTQAPALAAPGYEGLVNSEVALAGVSCSSQAPQAPTPGTYVVRCVGTDANYVIFFIDGTDRVESPIVDPMAE